VTKVLHGADYDVTTLKRDFGFTFAGLFDTMIAARFLGLPEVGLQGVLQRELGVAVTKEGQTADWSRRPLPPGQEAYALCDVDHLLRLHEQLRAKLAQVGRLAWVLEESEGVAGLEPARRGRDPEAWLRIKGLRRLPRRQQAVVREVWCWREQLAETTDVPAFKLMASETILALAEHPPANVAELSKVRGFSPRLRPHAEALFRSIARAMALPDSELPVAPPGAPRPNPTDACRRRVEELRAWRQKAALRLGIDVSLVLPQRLLDKVAEAAPRCREDLAAVPGLRRWRVEALGQEMLAACARR
jgi:ribonuclease D